MGEKDSFLKVNEVICLDENIFLIGTIHLDDKSVSAVDQAIRSVKPDTLLVELDSERLSYVESLLDSQDPFPPSSFSSLLSDNKTDFSKFSGFFSEPSIDGVEDFSFFLSNLQSFFGSFFGMTPGREIIHAVKYARLYNLSIVPIDIPLSSGAKRSHSGVDSVLNEASVMSLLHEKEELANLVSSNNWSKDDLLHFLSLFDSHDGLWELYCLFRERFPSIYDSLVAWRDRHMASFIHSYSLSHQNERILVIVGGAHLYGIVNFYQNL